MSEPCTRLSGFICLTGVGPRGHLHLDAADITGIAEDRDGRVTLVLRQSGTLVYVAEPQAEVEQKILATATLELIPAGELPYKAALVRVLSCIQASADQAHTPDMAAACQLLMRTSQYRDAARLLGLTA
jgi:hypothetical protein